MRLVQVAAPTARYKTTLPWSDSGLSAVSQVLPDHFLLCAGVKANQALWVWAYQGPQPDGVPITFALTIPLASLPVQAGPEGFGGPGRFSPFGLPAVVLHDGRVKLLVLHWRGDGDVRRDLYLVDTGLQAVS